MDQITLVLVLPVDHVNQIRKKREREREREREKKTLSANRFTEIRFLVYLRNRYVQKNI